MLEEFDKASVLPDLLLEAGIPYQVGERPGIRTNVFQTDNPHGLIEEVTVDLVNAVRRDHVGTFQKDQFFPHSAEDVFAFISLQDSDLECLPGGLMVTVDMMQLGYDQSRFHKAARILPDGQGDFMQGLLDNVIS